MADFDFETRLDRMFAEPLAFDDAEAFAARVHARLNRSWVMRGAVIGVLGAVGGVIGVGQLVTDGGLGRLSLMSSLSAQAASMGLNEWAFVHLNGLALPIGGVVLWMIAGMAALGVGFTITRLVADV